MSNLFATAKARVDYLNRTQAQDPKSSDFRDGSDAAGYWFDLDGERVVRVEQVVGGSGVYLVETDVDTGDIVRDNRPWQMTVG